MHKRNRWSLIASLTLLAGCMTSASTPQSSMTFFVSSTGSGRGGDFGGLAGADAHCQKLADAAGAGGRTWRAYLSTQPADGKPAVNARDRIGRGPWTNLKGEVIAGNVAELHSANKLTRMSAVTERGELVKGRGEVPNMHDILTGSRPDGTAFASGADRSCGNWTLSGAGSAMVGHHDRIGLRDDEPSRSWNSSHPTKGCSDEALRSTGGAGLLYCFAAN